MLDEAADNLARFPVDGNPALLDWLRQHRPPPVLQTLIHGDFTLDNVLVQDGQVTGIIDWSKGALGDPRYDLALATRPDDGVFQSPGDLRAFSTGYGGEPLSVEIQEYFVGLYEFF
jgi:aminoglycoside phosphotransferase (APT) family kinase protein